MRRSSIPLVYAVEFAGPRAAQGAKRCAAPKVQRPEATQTAGWTAAGPARKTSPRLFWIAPAASRGGRGQESLGQSARPERPGNLAGSDKNGKTQGDGNGPILINKTTNKDRK